MFLKPLRTQLLRPIFLERVVRLVSLVIANTDFWTGNLCFNWHHRQHRDVGWPVNTELQGSQKKDRKELFPIPSLLRH